MLERLCEQRLNDLGGSLTPRRPHNLADEESGQARLPAFQGCSLVRVVRDERIDHGAQNRRVVNTIRSAGFVQRDRIAPALDELTQDVSRDSRSDGSVFDQPDEGGYGSPGQHRRPFRGGPARAHFIHHELGQRFRRGGAGRVSLVKQGS